MKEIESFDQWQRSQEDLDIAISFAPGVRSRASEDQTVRVNCALPFVNLQRYTESQSLPLPEGLDPVDNLQHLLGVYLSRENHPQAASL